MEKKEINNTLIFTASLFSVCSLSLNYRTDCFWESFENPYLWFPILLPILFITYKWVLKTDITRRLCIASIILSMLFSSMEIVGHSLLQNSFAEIAGSSYAITKTIIRFLGYSIMFTASTITLNNKIIPYLQNSFQKFSVHKIIKKYSFMSLWVLFTICYLPYLIKYWPGLMNIDSVIQIEQTLNYFSLSDHHPVFHTLLIGLALKVGNLIIKDDLYIKIFVYSFGQLLACTACYAYAVKSLIKYNFSKAIIIISTIFFAIYPIFGFFSITMWKDIPFSLGILLFEIEIIKMLKKPNYWSSIRNIITFILISCIVFLNRHNGIHILIISIPFLILIDKKKWKSIIISNVSIIVLYLLWNFFIFNVLDARKGGVKEMLSIQEQFFGRLTKDKYNDLTPEEDEMIRKYIKIDKDSLALIYNPVISDPIKARFSQDDYKEDPLKFYSFWLKESFKYPKTAIIAFLVTNQPFWCLDELWDKKICTNTQDILDNLGLQSKPINSKLAMFDSIKIAINKNTIPILSIIFVPAFFFWIILFAITYLIIHKKYKILLLFIPLILLWLTCMAAPCCHFRYAFGLVTSFPIVLATIIGQKKENR